MTRYVLRMGGVFDRERGREIRSTDPEWRDYQAWLAAGNVPEVPARVVQRSTALREAKARVNDAFRAAQGRARVDEGGDSFDADERALGRLAAAALAVLGGRSLPADYRWRTADNRMVPCDAARLRRIFVAALARQEVLLARRWELKDAVLEGAQDPGAVDLRDGWPDGVPPKAPRLATTPLGVSAGASRSIDIEVGATGTVRPLSP